MDFQGFPVRMVGEGIDWPAWVQAVGSVAAIAFAGLLQRKTKLDQEADQMRALVGVFDVALSVINDSARAYEDWISGSLTDSFDPTRFTEANQLLFAVPSFQLGSTDAAIKILSMRQHVLRLSELRVPGPGTPLGPTASKVVEEVRLIHGHAGILRGEVWTEADKKVRRARRWWWPWM